MPNASRRLVLFDIDGTLIRGGSFFRESFLEAVAHLFPTPEFPAVSFQGKTDRQICREVIALAGQHHHATEETIDGIMHRYLEKVRSHIHARAHEVRVLPGIPEVLKELASHPRVTLGLLTGNVREGARIKLTISRLHDFFRPGVGAWGDDHHDRYQLPTIAVERAKRELNESFSGKEVVIIGDTIHDICCGKSIGVRSIAVGTGYGVPAETLLAENPDFYFKDLSDTETVVDAILEDL